MIATTNLQFTIRGYMELFTNSYHQAILEIMYNTWQRDDYKHYSKSEILAWLEKTYGTLAKFAVLLKEYHNIEDMLHDTELVELIKISELDVQSLNDSEVLEAYFKERIETKNKIYKATFVDENNKYQITCYIESPTIKLAKQIIADYKIEGFTLHKKSVRLLCKKMLDLDIEEQRLFRNGVASFEAERINS